MVALETNKKNSSSQEPYTLFHLPTPALFQLLDSNELKVEDENTVLSFVFTYSRHFAREPVAAIDLLS